jgi:hypothetical protein
MPNKKYKILNKTRQVNSGNMPENPSCMISSLLSAETACVGDIRLITEMP